MQLMLHTLKKDARRLWPAAAATWAMLAVLAHADRWRADWIPSPMEAWMNVLLSGAWACLAALAVLDEPLAGDRHFWMTRPHSRSALLAAKLVFAAIAVHAPSFLADVYVLAAREFAPAPYLGELLSKQLLLFACLTLPAIALASLMRTFTHFVLALFAIGAGLAILTGGIETFPAFGGELAEVRDGVVQGLLGITAAAVIVLQYFRRPAKVAWTIAAAGALAAVSAYSCLPVNVEYQVRSAGPEERPRIALRQAPPPGASALLPQGLRPQFAVMLPVALTPGRHNARFSGSRLAVELVTPEGVRLKTAPRRPGRPYQMPEFTAFLYATQRDGWPDWLVLGFTHGAWNRVRNAAGVRIRGEALFDFRGTGRTAVLPTQGDGEVPGLGRCAASTVDDRIMGPERLLKILCESPRSIPRTAVTLRHPSGRSWRLWLNSAYAPRPGPIRAWLSPLHRGVTFFRLVETVPAREGSKWLVAASDVPSSEIEITPEVDPAYAFTPFDFSGVNLTEWVVRP
jgi:hypothetical protein